MCEYNGNQDLVFSKNQIGFSVFLVDLPIVEIYDHGIVRVLFVRILGCRKNNGFNFSEEREGAL
ncbi:MAG: hypothetical protein D8M57_14970 [Candidatus Scalindua sp. AMX11]|nr:MAG: hypothetical protein DWQ00_04730 [Candidatus Scalindua sp.]TDE64113.1 MAG: hypothetical protein D8M57_14970 [Candidatus Scalindua sp. AMX11]